MRLRCFGYDLGLDAPWPSHGSDVSSEHMTASTAKAGCRFDAAKVTGGGLLRISVHTQRVDRSGERGGGAYCNRWRMLPRFAFCCPDKAER